MNNQEPILTIIIPSYNIAKYVDFCVPTFLNKELLKKINIYFIDDGATDDTKNKIEHYINFYPKSLFFVHKENGGHGSVINYGVYNCVKTKYFKIIDGDDWISSEEMLKLVNFLYECDSDLVLTNYVRVYKNHSIYMHPKKCDPSVAEIDNFDILLHTCTFKTSIFKKNNIRVRERVFYDDIEYVLYPLYYVKTFSYCDCYPYYYRLDNPNQSVSLTSFSKHYSDLYDITQDIAPLLTKMKNENHPFYKKGLKHAAECLGGYYYVVSYSDDSIKTIKARLKHNDKLLKNTCFDLRNQIRKANLYSRLFFAFNFSFVGLLKKRKIHG